MIYVYDRATNEYYKTDLEVLNPIMMNDLLNKHRDDLEKNYGKIKINPDTLIAYYDPFIVKIIVDSNNDFRRASNIEESNIEITYKDYDLAINEKNKGKIVKYYNGKIHKFEPDEVKVYNPIDNTYNTDTIKYRDYVVRKVSGAEQEIRNHGYYYDFWDQKYGIFAQPFRTIPDNDLQIFKSMKEDTPVNYRAIKLFPIEGDNRVTKVGSYKWLKALQVTDTFLQYQISMINTYSGFIKDAIFGMVNRISMEEDLDTLYYYNGNYVNIILKGISDKVDKIKELNTLKNAVTLEFQAANIKPLNDVFL